MSNMSCRPRPQCSIISGWLADKQKEIRMHTAVAAAIGATGLLLTAYFLSQGSAAGVVFSLALSSAGTMGAIPVQSLRPIRVACKSGAACSSSVDA